MKAGYSEGYAINAHANLVKNGGRVSEFIKERMRQLETPRIATATEVLEKLTMILRQELLEEVVELNPITGKYVVTHKKPTISEVIQAGNALLKRYPTKLEVQKLQAEIAKIQQDLVGNEEQDDKLTLLIESLKEAVQNGAD